MKYRIWSVIAAMGILLAVGGCRGGSDVTAALDPAEAKHVEERGDNTIHGRTFLETASGDRLTCAGMPVTLIPASQYASGVMEKVYGSTKKGFTSTEPDLGELDAQYARYTRESTCNQHGEFSFLDIPDGDYYVVSLVNLDVNAEESGDKRERAREPRDRRDDYREHRDNRHAYINLGPGPVWYDNDEVYAEKEKRHAEFTPWQNRSEHPQRNGRLHEGSLMQRVSVENGSTANLVMTTTKH